MARASAKPKAKQRRGAKRRREAPEARPAQTAATAAPIVGVGGSAGAIAALRSFVGAIPRETNLAFVIVLHLDRTHRSLLPEIIARDSKLPVVTAAEGLLVEPGNIYVIPSNVALSIAQRRLRLAQFPATDDLRTPIDTFFMSLAEDQAENCACVILSGTGSDGTLGLRAVKEHGGLALAQSDAEYDGMMHSAVSTGLVDFVLPAQEMPACIADYYSRGLPAPIVAENVIPLAQICAVLRARTGNDFSGYKERSLIRRVQRRLQVLKISDPPEFLERLRKEPHEVDLLLQDLLIGVTGFFRDPQVFAAVEKQVIPRLFADKGARHSIRIWVPGCSTGEEAYSIAMLLRDHQPKNREAAKFQIFASDIDERALEHARTGRYPATISRDVPERRLKRYFTREDGTYRVVSEIREVCLFSTHNLLRDAPFSKLDMISCRNLLIYLTPELQSRLVPLFHYALREGGYLLLGTSENVSRHTRLFTALDKPHRIFQRRSLPERTLPEFPLTMPDAMRRGAARSLRPSAVVGTMQVTAERQLLDHYAPAYIILNEEGELIYVSERVGKYVDLPAGAPTHNIFSLARRGLRLELRAALRHAISSKQVTIRTNLRVEINGGRQAMDLVVHPIPQPVQHDTLYMVVFKDVGPVLPVTKATARKREDELERVTVTQLEGELRATRERLQVTSEELESSNEELKSSNEELSSINEELQSTNEELETSKEELQSINEELQTLNTELKSRVDELSRVNSDISNLLESTQIATVFLDRDLAIKGFTPAAKDVFRLVESDIGRPLSHVRSRIRLDTVEDDSERVLRTLSAFEKQVETEDGNARFVMRILPYRTVDNVIAGVVLTFVDVTQMTAAEVRISELTRDLQNRVEGLKALLDLVPVGIFMAQDPSTPQQVEVNRYAARLLGEDGARKGPAMVGGPMRLMVGNSELAPEEQPLQRALRTGLPVAEFEARLLRADDTAVDVIASAMPLLNERGDPRGAVAAMVDITARKQTESDQEDQLEEMRHRVKDVLATVSSLAGPMLTSHPTNEDFVETFRARLRAMGASNDLLSAGKWQAVSLRSVAEIALKPYVGGAHNRVELRGPEIEIGARAVATLSMAFHELATNAAKYGALSDTKGKIDLFWRVESDAGKRRLAIEWRESGGPRVENAPKDSFGISFVERSVGYELKGSMEVGFESDGLKAVIAFPLGDVVTGD